MARLGWNKRNVREDMARELEMERTCTIDKPNVFGDLYDFFDPTYLSE